MSPTTRTIPCTTCSGTGDRVYPTYVDTEDNCTTCKGLGRVVVDEAGRILGPPQDLTPPRPHVMPSNRHRRGLRC